MVAKHPDRSITLCDSNGEVMARHDRRPERSAPDLKFSIWRYYCNGKARMAKPRIIGGGI
jgi:hypothetical protein